MIGCSFILDGSLAQEAQEARRSIFSATRIARPAVPWPTLITLAAIIVLLFYMLRAGWLPALQQFNHSYLQMLFFPLVLGLVWCTRLVPGRLILCSAIAAVFSVWMALHVFSNDRGAFHVARLADDPYETRSRIFREGLNAEFSWNNSVRGYRYWNTVENRAAADRVLREEDGVRSLVWGDQKRLHVSFGPARAVSLGELSNQTGSSLLMEFEVYSRIPVIGLPFEPAGAVRMYLAHLFEGVLPLEAPNIRVAGGIGIRHELDVRAAARVVSAWRTEEHRGFAWWVLGNYYLRKSLNDPASRRGYLNCATRAYQVAASYVRTAENPELFAAIHNNYAVNLLLNRFTGGGRVRLRHVRRSLRYAAVALSYSGNYDAALESFVPLQSNMKRLAVLKKNMLRGSVRGRSMVEKRQRKKIRRKRSGAQRRGAGGLSPKN